MTTVTYEELDSSNIQDMIKEHKSFEVIGLSGRGCKSNFIQRIQLK